MTYDIPKIDIECDEFAVYDNAYLSYPIHEYHFANGYGANVINCPISYGLELAVLRQCDDGGWKLCYDTAITDNVVGYISGPDELRDLLERIKGLKP